METLHRWHCDPVIIYYCYFTVWRVYCVHVIVTVLAIALLMPLVVVALGKLLPLNCYFHCRAPLLLCRLYIAMLFLVFSLSDRCPDVVIVFSRAFIVAGCRVMLLMPCRSQLLCNTVDGVPP